MFFRCFLGRNHLNAFLTVLCRRYVFLRRVLHTPCCLLFFTNMFYKRGLGKFQEFLTKVSHTQASKIVICQVSFAEFSLSCASVPETVSVSESCIGASWFLLKGFCIAVSISVFQVSHEMSQIHLPRTQDRRTVFCVSTLENLY